MKSKKIFLNTFLYHMATLVVCGSLLAGVSPAIGEDDVIIIANPSVSADRLSVDDLRAIFLSDKTLWNDGQRIVFAMMPDDPAHRQLLKQYVKRTENQFINYWKNIVFSGKGRMPAIFQEREGLMNFVRTTPGSIGYISGNPSEGVKVLEIQ